MSATSTLSEKILLSVGTGKDPSEIDVIEAITASAAELNVLAGATAANSGTSKAVITGTSGALTVAGALGVNAAETITSASATALAVGLAGATNPAFVVDSSVGSQAAGLSVTGATAAGTVAVASISSGAAANLTLNAKGTGTIGIGSVSTGAVTITPATTVTGTLTRGGVLTTPVEIPDATPYTVLAANSGKLHIINEQTANITINLPVIATGMNYEFIMGGVANEAQNWIFVATTPSFFNGGVVWHDEDSATDNTAPFYGNGSSHLTFTVVTPMAGTVIRVFANSTPEWVLHGAVNSPSTPTIS